MRAAAICRRNGVTLPLLTVVAIGAAAIPSAFSAHRSERGEAILIKTRITFGPKAATGEVLRGSFIGDSAFCRGGRLRDRPGEGGVIRTFRCPNGSLKISFRPRGEPPTVSSPWKVVGGSGRFEELRGHGWMVERDAGPRQGRETLTGTVAG